MSDSEFKKFCSEVVTCRKCFSEFTMQKFYGFYDGAIHHPLMIVGQSPVYPLPKGNTRPFSLMDDDHQHRGSQWMRECFNLADLDYMTCYITNLVKDSAKDNKINSTMINYCSKFLEKEISMFTGKVILALGTPCCKWFNIKPGDSYKNNSGKYVFGSRHPSYLMKKGIDGKVEFIEILKKINFLIEGNKKKK